MIRMHGINNFSRSESEQNKNDEENVNVDLKNNLCDLEDLPKLNEHDLSTHL